MLRVINPESWTPDASLSHFWAGSRYANGVLVWGSPHKAHMLAAQELGTSALDGGHLTPPGWRREASSFVWQTRFTALLLTVDARQDMGMVFVGPSVDYDDVLGACAEAAHRAYRKGRPTYDCVRVETHGGIGLALYSEHPSTPVSCAARPWFGVGTAVFISGLKAPPLNGKPVSEAMDFLFRLQVYLQRQGMVGFANYAPLEPDWAARVGRCRWDKEPVRNENGAVIDVYRLMLPRRVRMLNPNDWKRDAHLHYHGGRQGAGGEIQLRWIGDNESSWYDTRFDYKPGTLTADFRELSFEGLEPRDSPLYLRALIETAAVNPDLVVMGGPTVTPQLSAFHWMSSTEEEYDEALGDLFPTARRLGMFLHGEASGIDRDGKQTFSVYATRQLENGGHRYFRGSHPITVTQFDALPYPRPYNYNDDLHNIEKGSISSGWVMGDYLAPEDIKDLAYPPDWLFPSSVRALTRDSIDKLRYVYALNLAPATEQAWRTRLPDVSWEWWWVSPPLMAGRPFGAGPLVAQGDWLVLADSLAAYAGATAEFLERLVLNNARPPWARLATMFGSKKAHGAVVPNLRIVPRDALLVAANPAWPDPPTRVAALTEEHEEEEKDDEF